MISKIDKSLFNQVNSLSSQSNLHCIIYCNNLNTAKMYINRTIGKDFACYPFINAIGISVSTQNIYKLAKIDAIKYITSNSKVNALIDVSKKIIKSPTINTTSNFSIVVIDTGIYPHLDFMVPQKRIIKFIDLINDNQLPYDDNGHGTFISGVIAGQGSISPRHKGVDDFSNIIVIKALDKNGETSAHNILQAMQWVYDNKKIYNIKAVCMSFGSTPVEIKDPLVMGAETLWDNGIVVVCAAGNSGPLEKSIKAPGVSSKIITVGALDDNRDGNDYNFADFEVAEFSSRGPANNNYKPDILAPGVEIKGINNFTDKKFYTIMSGTSVSTPIVVGVVSNIIKKYPWYSPNQIKNILLNSTISLNVDKNEQGYGLIDCSQIFS